MLNLQLLGLLAELGPDKRGDSIASTIAGIVLLATIAYLLRYLSRCRGVSDRAMSQMDEHSQAITRGREHMEAAERHMEAVEKKLDEVIDQLNPARFRE